MRSILGRRVLEGGAGILDKLPFVSHFKLLIPRGVGNAKGQQSRIENN